MERIWIFMKITEDIIYAGVNDHQVDLFEGQYKVPNGMAYNSYVILDEKTAVMDTVDANFADEWLANVAKALDGRKPDYLIVQHMEPDHAANIEVFAEKYPKDCSRIQTTEEGSETYIIQKGRLSLNLRPPYSEARKQKAAKQIQKVWKEMKGIP